VKEERMAVEEGLTVRKCRRKEWQWRRELLLGSGGGKNGSGGGTSVR
jgi:hypothetical protein